MDCSQERAGNQPFDLSLSVTPPPPLSVALALALSRSVRVSFSVSISSSLASLARPWCPSLIEGILAYRTLSLERETNKMIHNACMFAAVILVSLGLIAVFQVPSDLLYFLLFLMPFINSSVSILLCDPEWRVDQRCRLAPTVDGASPHTCRHAGLRKSIPPNMEKKKRGMSVTHYGWHVMSRICVSSKAPLPPRSTSVLSTRQYHNEELYANLYTMHSWAGIVVVTLFYANYVGGFFNFFTGSTPQWVRGTSDCSSCCEINILLS